jgi:N-acetylglucosaminyldiphosphoundecaprenol N-acetyl-beta-D-mannosaminyltransferase
MISTEASGCEPRLYSPPRLDIVGVPVTSFESYDQALNCIENAIASGCKWFCAAVNPIKIYNAWHDPELKCLLNQVDVLICDGMGVARASQILYGQKIERITGCDLFFALLLIASRRQWGVYLLGASAESNAAACTALRTMYPALKIAGSQDGYFKDSHQVVEDINASGAKLLFVAMGSPKQEQWICRHRDAIEANLCMGVGGSFDVAAGSVKRAPRFFRMTGTEFLFRFALEPRKRLSQQKVLLNFMTRIISTRLSVPRGVKSGV